MMTGSIKVVKPQIADDRRLFPWGRSARCLFFLVNAGISEISQLSINADFRLEMTDAGSRRWRL